MDSQYKQAQSNNKHFSYFFQKDTNVKVSLSIMKNRHFLVQMVKDKLILIT